MHRIIFTWAVFVFCCNGFAQTIDGNNGALETLKGKTTEQLLDILNKKPLSIKVPPEMRQERNNKARQSFEEQRRQKFEEERLLYAQTRKLLVEKGDSLIGLLSGKLQRFHTATFEKHAMMLLSEMGTPKAKQFLLDVTLGQASFNCDSVISSIALHEYLKIADANEVKQLLVSDELSIFLTTLRKHPRLINESSVFNRINRLLQSDNFNNRWTATNIVSDSPNNEEVIKKMRALTESLKTVAQLPKANERYQHDSIGTYSDVLCSAIAKTLISLQDDKQQLNEIAKNLNGLSRQWIVVVRAHRGDVSVKEELVSILQDNSALERTRLRLSGIRALGEIGTQDEIPFLKEISESDTYELLDRGGPLLEKVNGAVINNTGERSLAVQDKLLSIDLWANARITYPVRQAAKQAIAQIEAKIRN